VPRPRLFPALDLIWPVGPDEETVGRLLADLDDMHPTAVEDRLGGIRVFFSRDHDRDRAIEALAASRPPPIVSVVSVADAGWAERSQAGLTRVRVGRLIVTPPWAAGRVDAETSAEPARLITILPSMGFGTGHHQSTRLCLRLLQQVELSGLNVLDVGTGSGVLAIGAWRLGATRVLGIDLDPDALASAQKNVELNGAAAGVHLRALDVSRESGELRERFDVVTANLTGAMLERFAAVLAEWLRENGTLIASGFQCDEQDDVIRALAGAGLHMVSTVFEDDWAAVSAIATPTRSREH
jgi:ribosomal protein L11 methyltransferase